MTPEGGIKAEIVKYLTILENNGYKILQFRRQAGGFAYKKGLPDLYVIFNGKHIEIEVKQPNGSMSTMQETWARRFKDLGIYYICVDSIEEFKKFFDDIMKHEGDL